MGRTADDTGTPVATLAFFNSLGGYPRGSRVRSRLLCWMWTESLQRGFCESTKAEPASNCVSSCVSIVTPPVPQQRDGHDCGVFSLSFFASFFSCEKDRRCVLLRADDEAWSAWQSLFVLKNRAELRAVCGKLIEREDDRTTAEVAVRAAAIVSVTACKADDVVMTCNGDAPSLAVGAVQPTGSSGPLAAPSSRTQEPQTGSVLADHADTPWSPSDRSQCPASPLLTCPLPRGSTTLPVVKDEASPPPTTLAPSATVHPTAAQGYPPLPVRRPSPRVEAPAARVGFSPTGYRGPPPAKPPAAAFLQKGPAGAALCLSARGGAETRRVEVTSATAVAWLADFDKWGLVIERDAALEVIAVFSRCEGLLPSFVTHFSKGLIKNCPPVTLSRVEPWFVDLLVTGSGSAAHAGGGAVLRVLLSHVHSVFSAAYAFHGTSLPSGV